MSLIQRTLTPIGLRARRQNSLESTGPRASAGKGRAARNGWPMAKPGRSTLPRRRARARSRQWEELVAELSDSYQPANAAERLLVGDLARLRALQQNNFRAQEGLIRKILRQLECRRAACLQEATLESPEYPFQAAEIAGLINMEDSPAKSKHVGRLLRILIDDVEAGHFSEEGRKFIVSLYGPMVTMRGARVLGNYVQLLEAGFRSSAANVVAPVSPRAEGEANLPADKQGAADTVSGRDDLHLRVCYADLRRALEEEKTLLGGKYERYLAEDIPSDAALQHEALVPSEKGGQALARQADQIEKQIEAKTRLLLFTQWVRRSTEPV